MGFPCFGNGKSLIFQRNSVLEGSVTSLSMWHFPGEGLLLLVCGSAFMQKSPR